MSGILNENLTVAHPASQSAALSESVPGQAHFAVPGTDKRCADCKHWDKDYKSRLYAKPCLKYSALMSGKRGAPVPPVARACKYFEARQ